MPRICTLFNYDLYNRTLNVSVNVRNNKDGFSVHVDLTVCVSCVTTMVCFPASAPVGGTLTLCVVS